MQLTISTLPLPEEALYRGLGQAQSLWQLKPTGTVSSVEFVDAHRRGALPVLRDALASLSIAIMRIVPERRQVDELTSAPLAASETTALVHVQQGENVAQPEPMPNDVAGDEIGGLASGEIELIIRISAPNVPGRLGMLPGVISDAGGVLIAIESRATAKTSIVQDLTITVPSERIRERVRKAIEAFDGVRILDISDSTTLAHLGGEIYTQLTHLVKTRHDLSIVYTPGVARVAAAVAADPAKAYALTIKRNTVCVLTDGTAVLGLGNIGPSAAAPVMESKCALFKQFADIDAFPICLDTKDVDEIVRTAKVIAPIFGGICLDDIDVPHCFEVERRLADELNIPVMHDDQDGTAVVILAALMNAAAAIEKRIVDLTVVLAGSSSAAGAATIKLLLRVGVRDVIAVDTCGAISRRQQYDNPIWSWLAENTNRENRTGTLKDALIGADVFVGVSVPGLLDANWINFMARDPIVFAIGSPESEVMPLAAATYAAVVATGRSNFPNHITSLLSSPGIFRGALDCRASKITEGMKLAAAHAIADLVRNEVSPEYIIPSIFDTRLVDTVADAVRRVAIAEGVARRELLISDDTYAAPHAQYWVET